MTNANQRIWAIAGPAILSNISTASVGIVDSWAVGHLDNPLDLAGLALGAMLFSFLLWSLGFLRMGTTGMVAQDKGARLRGRLHRTVARALTLALGLGLIILVLAWPLSMLALSLMAEGDAEAQIARTYLDIRLWAMPFIMVKMVVVGTMIGLQRAGTALAIEVFVNIVNVVLTVVLVVILNFGVEGAAFSSLVAEILAGLAALMALGLRLHPRLLKKAVSQARFWKLHAFARLFNVNGYLFLRTLFLVTAFAIFVGVGDHLGPNIVAGNHVLLNLITLVSLGLDGMAFAAEALVGEAIGARSKPALGEWVRRTHIWAVLLASGYAMIFWAFGTEIIDSFTHHLAIRATAYDVLPWLILLPLIAVWGYQYDGIFVGATAAKEMLVTIVIAFLSYGLALLILVPAFGNHGLWAAFLIFFAVRGASQALIWRRLAPGYFQTA